jgi:hypothetical protein
MIPIVVGAGVALVVLFLLNQYGVLGLLGISIDWGVLLIAVILIGMVYVVLKLVTSHPGEE